MKTSAAELASLGELGDLPDRMEELRRAFLNAVRTTHIRHRPNGSHVMHFGENTICPPTADLTAGDDFTTHHDDDVVIDDGFTWNECVRCGRRERATL